MIIESCATSTVFIKDFCGEILINLFPFQNQMVQGVASLASHDGDIHIPGGGPRLIYVHISLGKIDLLSHFDYILIILYFCLSFKICFQVRQN